MDLVGELGHLGLLAVGVAAGAGHLDAVALQDGRLCSGGVGGRQRRGAEVRRGDRDEEDERGSSPMLALLFISFRRLANQL